MIEVAEMRCHIDVCFSMRRVGWLGHCILLYISQLFNMHSHFDSHSVTGYDSNRSIRLEQKSFRIRTRAPFLRFSVGISETTIFILGPVLYLTCTLRTEYNLSLSTYRVHPCQSHHGE